MAIYHLLEFVGARNRWESQPTGLTITYDGGTTAWLWSDGRVVTFAGELAAYLVDGALPLKFDGAENRFMSENHALRARFLGAENVWELTDGDIIKYAVRASWEGQGTVTGAGVYAPGETVSVAAIAAPDWELGRWVVGAEQDPPTPWTFTMPAATVSIFAMFALSKVDVSLHFTDSKIQDEINASTGNAIEIDGVADTFDGSSYNTALTPGQHTVAVKVAGTNYARGAFVV